MKKKVVKQFIMVILSVLIVVQPIYSFAAVSGLSTATSITSGEFYYIRNKYSSHYLDAENSKNFNVIQYSFHGAYNQAWKITKISSGVYTIQNKSLFYLNQGRCMLSVSQTSDNVDLYYSTDGLTTQQWYITANSDGTFTIKNVWSGKALSTSSSTTSSPANIGHYTYSSGTNQKWYLEKIPRPNALTANLKTQFPSGNYWNHAQGNANSPTSVRTTPCSHHPVGTSGNCNTNTGSCGCNMFSHAIQCWGFALYLGNRYYLQESRNWNAVNLSAMSNDDVYATLTLLKPGDILRYNEHSIYVTSISSDLTTFYAVDVNYNRNCNIRWGTSFTISDIAYNTSPKSLVKAPYILL